MPAAAAAAIGGGGAAGGHAAHLLVRRGGARHGHLPRPALIFFHSRAEETPRGNFFCLPTKIFVAKLRAANLFVTTKFATKQFEGGEFNHVHPNLPLQSQPRSQTMPSPSHLSSHAPLTEPRSSLKQEQLPRSNAPLTLSPSPLSHNAREGMIPRPPTHS